MTENLHAPHISGDLRERAQRLAVEFPVHCEQGKGVSRDISATGMYFIMDQDCQPGSLIDLSIELETPAGSLIMQCQGEVKRVQQQNGKTGIAIHFLKQEIVTSRP